MKKITLEALRWYLVQHQRLDHKIKAKDYQTLFSAISAIQFDPLDVIGQNLELALFARMEDVTRLKIHNLLYEDYKIIDGWDKVMSVFLREDWRYLHFVRERRAEREISIITHRKNTEALQYEEEVKEILQQQEDVYARDLILGSANDGGWGSRSNSGVCLDYLFHQGKAFISNRRVKDKAYSEITRLFEGGIVPSPFFSEQKEFLLWYTLRRIKAIGAYWSKNGDGWLGEFISKKAIRVEILEELKKRNKITMLHVEGIKEPILIPTDELGNLTEAEKRAKNDQPRAVRFIAPLDNLLWDRKYTEIVFDFSYIWEVYKPKAERKYGYYVLPVLYGNRFIARFEPERHQKGDIVRISQWWWEKDVTPTKQMIELIQQELLALSIFLNQTAMPTFTESIALEVRKKIDGV